MASLLLLLLQVCLWCWHHIMDMAEKDESEGRCPACRTTYEKEKVVKMQANIERFFPSWLIYFWRCLETECNTHLVSNRAGNNNVHRKSKQSKAKPKSNEIKKDLTNARVIQRKMAYVIGLPLSLADEDVWSYYVIHLLLLNITCRILLDHVLEEGFIIFNSLALSNTLIFFGQLLQRKEYFGQYGKISKISLSRTAGGSIQLLTNDTCSVWVWHMSIILVLCYLYCNCWICLCLFIFYFIFWFGATSLLVSSYIQKRASLWQQWC